MSNNENNITILYFRFRCFDDNHEDVCIFHFHIYEYVNGLISQFDA